VTEALGGVVYAHNKARTERYYVSVVLPQCQIYEYLLVRQRRKRCGACVASPPTRPD